MSDEAARRRVPFIAAAVLSSGLLAAAWLRGEVMNDYRAFKGFCSATHPGETWEHVKERGVLHDWLPSRHSREGAQPEEWMFVHEFFSYRAGCVVTLAKNRVVSTRFAELPRE